MDSLPLLYQQRNVINLQLVYEICFWGRFLVGLTTALYTWVITCNDHKRKSGAILYMSRIANYQAEKQHGCMYSMIWMIDSQS